MPGDDRVRHCKQCDLNVYNFAELTRTEIENLVAAREGRLCARLYKRADGTMMTKDCPVGFHMKVRRISRIAGAALSAAMAAVPAVGQAVQQSQSGLVQIAARPAQIEIEVVDPTGAVIPNATVHITNKATNFNFEKQTDASGRVRLLDVGEGTYTVSAERSGFKTTTDELMVPAGKQVDLEIRLQLDLEATMGVLVEFDNAVLQTMPSDISQYPLQTGQTKASTPSNWFQKVRSKLHF